MSQNFKLNLFFGLYLSTVIAVNLIGAKTATLWGITFSVGLIIFPLTFFIIDIVSEVFGKQKSQEFLWISLICQAVVLIFLTASVNLPPSQRYAPYDTAYRETLGQSIRIILASLSAYALANLGDIWSFFFLKNKTQGKFLWLRSDLSTTISQFIDTFTFMFLAFYQLTPRYTFWFVVQISIPYYISKLVLAYIGTPIVYLGVKWLKSGKGNEKYQIENK